MAQFKDDFLGSLINAGADAQSNLYYAVFSDDSAFTTAVNSIDGQALSVRLRKFTPPKFTQKSNEVKFMNVGINIPMVAMSGTKEISMTFRLDSNYRVYKYLLDLMARTMDVGKSYALTAPADKSLNIKIYGPTEAVATSVSPNRQTEAHLPAGNEDASDNFCKFYEFKNCWLKELDSPKFTYQQANPLEVTAKFGFFEFVDPTSIPDKNMNKNLGGNKN